SAAARPAASKPPLRIGATYSFNQFYPNPTLFASYGREGNFEVNFEYATILHQMPSGKLTPELATSWRTFSTGRGPNEDFEFTLRNDAKFADGTPVDANAVAGWLSWYSANNATYGPVMGPKPTFEAIGQSKVRARLTTPVPNFFQLLSDTGPYFGFPAS